MTVVSLLFNDWAYKTYMKHIVSDISQIVLKPAVDGFTLHILDFKPKNFSGHTRSCWDFSPIRFHGKRFKALQINVFHKSNLKSNRKIIQFQIYLKNNMLVMFILILDKILI